LSSDTIEFVRAAIRYFEEDNGRQPETIEEYRFVGKVAREMQKINAEFDLRGLPLGDETVWN
jgi:hypothetical protein